MIIACRCANAFQDAMYGVRMRVHNQTKQNGRNEDRRYRCTVCLDEKNAPSEK